MQEYDLRVRIYLVRMNTDVEFFSRQKSVEQIRTNYALLTDDRRRTTQPMVEMEEPELPLWILYWPV
jgi:hypothetical protein